jgi:hypothetical protein
MSGGSDSGESDFKARARLRERLLIKTFSLLTKPWSQAERDRCVLNRQLVRIVSESYFKDLDRKKKFHGIQYADSHKRAGYMVKWIMRFRPVQMMTEGAKPRVLLVNEHFALTVAFKFLNIPPASVPPPLYKNLVYALRFRALDANAWALSFFLLQSIYGLPPQPHVE